MWEMSGAPSCIHVSDTLVLDSPWPTWRVHRGPEWSRVVPVLANRKILTEADVGSIENYCIAIGTVREMEREIRRLGHVQKVYKVDKDGESCLVSMRRNPAVGILNDAMKTARLYAAELGATPVSRSRPTVDEDDDEDDLFGWQGAG